MRVGLVIPSFDPRRGGAEQWTWQFALLLAQQGHEVHVLASTFGPQAEQAPLTKHLVPHGRSRLTFAAAAEEAARRLPLDLVHDMGGGWHCDIFQPHGGSRKAAMERNLMLDPLWLRPFKRVGMRFLPRYRTFRRLARRQFVPDGRIFLALSRMVASDFVHHHEVPEEQIRIVYNGVDLDRFSPDRQHEHRDPLRKKLGIRDEVLILIVAHNFALKGVPALLSAVGRLVRQGKPVRLLVAGGKRVEPYRRLAEQLGAGLAARFLGAVDDASPYYAAADLYVQPTFYDPCSLVVLEALASGLPVVTTRFNGAGELITPGVEGYLMDNPANVEELGFYLDQLLDPKRRRHMAVAARALAMQHSLARNGQEIVAVYEEHLKHQRSPRPRSRRQLAA